VGAGRSPRGRWDSGDGQPDLSCWDSGTAGSPPTGNAVTLGVRRNSRCLFYYYHWWSALRLLMSCAARCFRSHLTWQHSGFGSHSRAIGIVLPACTTGTLSQPRHTYSGDQRDSPARKRRCSKRECFAGDNLEQTVTPQAQTGQHASRAPVVGLWWKMRPSGLRSCTQSSLASDEGFPSNGWAGLEVALPELLSQRW